ncbi:MAG: 50S ribosomal protein L24 [Pseudomonadales bacterium]|nr:50S ribosomal protein L24 [Pseudomonadales bacterium]
MRKLRKDDRVVVLAGKSKGATGTVMEFVGDDRVKVSGVNFVYRHYRARRPGEREGILEQEAALHVSNVAILNQETNKPDRVGFKIEDGRKLRIYKSSGKEID